MKIIINQNELKKALSICGAAVGKINLSTPIDGILFSASSNELKLTSYDYDTAITCKTNAKIVEPGELLVSYKLLNDIVSKCLGDITIETDVSHIIIINEAAKYKLASQSVDTFPELPNIETDTDTMVIPYDIFYNGTRKVERFISANVDAITSRPLMGTAQIKVHNNHITFVATDSCKLVRYTAQLDSDKDFEVYLNKKVLRNCLEEEAESIKISKGKRHNIIEINNVTIVTRTYTGDFVPYEPILEQATQFRGVMSVKTFKNAVEAVCPVVVDSARTPLKMDFTQGEMAKFELISSLGDSIISCPFKEGMKNKNGEYFQEVSGMNIKFILDTLSVCTDDDIVIRQNNAFSPLMIDEKDTSYVLMPMRLKSNCGITVTA